MRHFEPVLWRSGVRDIAGVDEAGVGSLAGPVVAAAVMFPPDTDIAGVDDSKKLEPEVRWVLAQEIRAKATGIGFGHRHRGRNRRDQHLSRVAARHAPCRRSVAADAAAHSRRCAHRSRCRRTAEHVQQGRRHQLQHRRGVDHREDRARSHHGCARSRVSRYGLRPTRDTPRPSTARRCCDSVRQPCIANRSP